MTKEERIGLIVLSLGIIFTLIYVTTRDDDALSSKTLSKLTKVPNGNSNSVPEFEGLNTMAGRKRELEDFGLSSTPTEFKMRQAITPIELPVQEVGGGGAGESKYDADITSLTQLQDLNETRAELQPWYDKIEVGILIFFSFIILIIVIIFMYYYKEENVMEESREKGSEELLKERLRQEFEEVAQDAIRKGSGDLMLDAMLLKASIGSFYQSMKSSQELEVACMKDGIDYQDLLEEECINVLNKYLK